jgi:hypothetical protein
VPPSRAGSRSFAALVAALAATRASGRSRAGWIGILAGTILASAYAAGPPPVFAPPLPAGTADVTAMVVWRGQLVAAGKPGFVASGPNRTPVDGAPSALAGARGLFVAGQDPARGGAWVARLKPDFSVDWRTTLPAEVDKVPHGLVPAGDGVVACGLENPLQTGALFGWLGRVAGDGTRGWELSLGGAAYDLFYDCAERDGVILAVGSNGPQLSADAWLVGVTPKGIVQFDVRVPDRGTWTVARAVVADEAGFVVFGEHANAQPHGGGEPFLWRVEPVKGEVSVVGPIPAPEPVTVVAADRGTNGIVWVVANGANAPFAGAWDGKSVRWTEVPGLRTAAAVTADGDGAWIGGAGADGVGRIVRLR